MCGVSRVVLLLKVKNVFCVWCCVCDLCVVYRVVCVFESENVFVLLCVCVVVCCCVQCVYCCVVVCVHAGVYKVVLLCRVCSVLTHISFHANVQKINKTRALLHERFK